ncbi:MAG: porin family protein [Gemmatimonadales bacterium]|jgi:hypothetical protein|nr:MAG: porin family protein [Gemmatimonadales bacterium]
MRFIRSSALAALSIFALGSTALEAQDGLTFGVRGGVSVASASLDASQTFDKSNRTGIAGGLFLDYATSSVFGFQIGAQYTQKGVELDFGSGNTPAFDLGYLDIPAVLKLGIPLGIIRPSIFGGVGLGFQTQCEVSGEDCGDVFKGSDFHGIVGLDLAIYLGGLSLWADGRYNVGLQNIADASDVVGDLKNRNWTLQVGIGF